MPTQDIRPVPIDSNGHRLFDRGTQWFTKRYTSIDSTGFDGISFPYDVKEIWVHIEGAVECGVIRGTLPGVKSLLDAAAVVDNEDGTVTIPAEAHGFIDGETITIAGTVNYDGDYEVLAAGDTDNLVVTAIYVAETIPAIAYATCYRDAHLTSDGYDFGFPVCLEAGETCLSFQAPAGLTKNLSVFGMR